MIEDPEKEIEFYSFSNNFNLTFNLAEKYSTNFFVNNINQNEKNILNNYKKSVLPFSTVYGHNFDSLPIPKYYSWNVWNKIFNE